MAQWTTKALLQELLRMAREDGRLREAVTLADILDYCALVGLPGASEAYLHNMQDNCKICLPLTKK